MVLSSGSSKSHSSITRSVNAVHVFRNFVVPGGSIAGQLPGLFEFRQQMAPNGNTRWPHNARLAATTTGPKRQ